MYSTVFHQGTYKFETILKGLASFSNLIINYFTKIVEYINVDIVVLPNDNGYFDLKNVDLWPIVYSL